MARSVRIEWDGRAVGEILTSDAVRATLTERAERVLAKAKADAPVASGAYRDGLHLIQDTTDRAVVRVSGATDHDWFVEAATGNLARSIDAAGGA